MSKASDAARALIARTRLATLATLSDGGGPLATLVAVADDGEGRPLFLLSGLAEHTRNLRQRPRASVLLVDAAHGPGGQMDRLRVTLTGSLSWLDGADAALAKTRFVEHHPDAQQYASLPDFTPGRLEVEAVRVVGGFARAVTLPLDEYRAAPGPPRR